MINCENHHADLLRSGLAECMVLLKKNGAFPLKRPCRLAAFGNGVRRSVKGGTGSGDVNAHIVVNVEQGLRNAGFQLIGSDWLDGYERVREAAKKDFRKQVRKEAHAAGDLAVTYAMGAVMPEPEYALPLDFSADAAIYVLSRISGEGSDRRVVPGDVLLTETERSDILALNAHYERFMLVLNTGGPVDLTPVREVGNILLLSQLGSEMGNGLADVLLGKTTPSGKLTTTWAAWEDYCPDIQMGDADETEYREGVYVGYRYFDTVGKRPLFPFGFGLSYTDFTVEPQDVQLSGSTVTVRAKVTNTGAYAGKEVVQVYVTAPERKLKKPWQDLVGFVKTSLLPPGASETVTVTFDLRSAASFDEAECAYVLERGDYILRLGTSSADTHPVAVIELDRDVTVRKTKPVAATANVEEVQYARSADIEDTSALPRLRANCSGLETEAVSPPPREDAAPEIRALSDEELAYLAVGHFTGTGLLSVIGNASVHVPGAAGETTSRLAAKGIRPLIMADGPAGLRLARRYYRDDKGAHAVGGGTIPESVLDILSPTVRKLALAVTGGKKPPKGAVIHEQRCTAIPIGTAIAQSWNTELAEAFGDIVGAEMEQFGVNLWLAPALNIHRSILCGRNFEYFSEDPLISGRIAAALTRGVQAHPGCGVTIKHFAANNQEYNRYYNNSHVSERALCEIYLRGFRICIEEAQPCAVMTSYNLLNGTHTSESRALTEGFLRTECGFLGIVMTDWVMKLKNHGTRYKIAKADRAAAAGNDLFMPGNAGDCRDILRALRAGTLNRAQLEESGTRVLRMTRKLNR